MKKGKLIERMIGTRCIDTEELERILVVGKASFENVLKLIEMINTQNIWQLSIDSNNKPPIFTKDKMVEEISKCEQKYDEIVLNNNIVSLNYNMNEIQSKLIKLKYVQLLSCVGFLSLDCKCNIKFTL